MTDRLRIRLLFGLGLGVAALLPAYARAQVERPRESLVKAAFLHKFPSFVEWPAGTFPQPDTPLRVGVIGDDQLARDLREFARERERDGRPMTVVRQQAGDPLQGLHMVFVRGSSAGRIADIVSAAPPGVLTVVDADGAHPTGSVLAFFIEEGRVRFSASVDAATRQRLRLSSRLLSVARMA
ncbi:YfiR family protein [Ramlibacter sp.]|uniref:YfiR family protein n=1 Tax=Ramlibacter sp. TaxID=1917967 RepID=UPI003D14CB64